MGAARGRGLPLRLRCHVWRRTPEVLRVDGEHLLFVTGRTRSNENRRATHNGRMLPVEYEYVCLCGHTGWSRHPDVLTLPAVA